MTVFGRVVGDPFNDYAGATVAVAVTIGDTWIEVDDVSDFDEDAAVNGGTLIVGLEVDQDGEVDESNATRIPYSTFDEDAGTVTLTAPSPVAIAAGDFLWTLDPVSDGPVFDVTVYVQIEGADQDGDPLPALAAHELITAVDVSEVEGMPVELSVDEDDQLVARPVAGNRSKGGRVKFYQDSLAVEAVGEQILKLTYRPVKNSEHLYWNGVYQPGSEWSRAGWRVAVPDADGVIEVDDQLVMEYAYRDPEPRPVLGASLFLVGVTTSTTHVTEIDLPAGTQAGDLMVLSLCAANNADCTDPRFVYSQKPSAVFWVGYGWADSSGDPVPVTQEFSLDWCPSVLAVYRVRGDVTVAWTGLQAGAVTPTPPDGDVGVVAFNAFSGTIADGLDDDDSTGEWTTDGRAIQTKLTSLVCSNQTGLPPGDWGSINTWTALTIALTEET